MDDCDHVGGDDGDMLEARLPFRLGADWQRPDKLEEEEHVHKEKRPYVVSLEIDERRLPSSHVVDYLRTNQDSFIAKLALSLIDKRGTEGRKRAVQKYDCLVG